MSSAPDSDPMSISKVALTEMPLSLDPVSYRKGHDLSIQPIHGSRTLRRSENVSQCTTTRYVSNLSLPSTLIGEKIADDYPETSKSSGNYCIAANVRGDEQDDSIVPSTLTNYVREPQAQSIALANVVTWGTPNDKDDPVESSCKQSQDHLDLIMDPEQRSEVSLPLIKVVSPQTIHTERDDVLSRKPLEIHKLSTGRVLRTAKAIQVNSTIIQMETCTGNKETTLGDQFNTKKEELVIESSFDDNSDIDFNDVIEWYSTHDLDSTDIVESPISSVSSISPISPLHEQDLGSATEESSRNPSTATEGPAEKCLGLKTSSPDSSLLVIGGKTHAHPLRSHPTQPSDYQHLPQYRRKFPPQDESLPCSPTTIQYMVTETASSKPQRPSFPPRVDSLPSLRSKQSLPTMRSMSSFSSLTGARTTTKNKSQLSIKIPEQKKSHRRSISGSLFAFAFSPVSPRFTRTQPQVAEEMEPSTFSPESTPSPIPTPEPSPLPWIAPSKSRNRNASLIPLSSDNRSAALITATSRARNASLVPLPSENRRTFVIQQANTSAFSLHSKNSLQDLAGIVTAARTDSIPLPTSVLVDGSVNDNGSTAENNVDSNKDTRIVVENTLNAMTSPKEPRLRRILNLRRNNADGSGKTSLVNVLTPVHETSGADGRSASVSSSAAGGSTADRSEGSGTISVEHTIKRRPSAFQGGMVGSRRR